MIRVLVVDDDFMVAKLHSTLVSRVPGFEVAGVAHSGSEALSLVRELAPDLVLLDLYLPDVSGLEVLRQLRGDGAPGGGPDVLVITAARDAASVRAARHGGAVQYVVKPFEGRLLSERLERFAHERSEFERLSAPGQDELDRVFSPGAHAPEGGEAQGHGAAGTEPRESGLATRPQSLPKGLTEQTCALVRRTLEAGPAEAGLSASECAERSGLSRVSARRYLEHFVATGTATVTLRYGTTGRPERRYHRL
ncbi:MULTISPECIES: response regulator [unclassified Streptomyces]|uniref:response regulator n=1 Tax=unclassified Streptomyces TaxID=2593676 RepID=UPI002DD8F3C5|nr:MULTISPECIES: response regulator [unclassified Streptomyces]WSA94874.1 response regulator [Streptomyces sp. NBC_01795]WSB79294.1 response regulator [Streptomyces sp. NBC_01775]WSS41288.1 response regulator [Streptomyces sp. NBC_01187]